MADHSPLKMPDDSPPKMADKSPSKMADNSPSSVADHSSSGAADHSSSKIADEPFSSVAENSPSSMADNLSSKMADNSPSNAAASAPLDRLPRFTKLPQEIQDMIWLYALDAEDGRVVYLREPRWQVRSTPPGYELCTSSPGSSLLHACHGSRIIAQRVHREVSQGYHLCPIMPPQAPFQKGAVTIRNQSRYSDFKVYIHPTKDIICFHDQSDMSATLIRWGEVEKSHGPFQNYGWTIYPEGFQAGDRDSLNLNSISSVGEKRRHSHCYHSLHSYLPKDQYFLVAPKDCHKTKHHTRRKVDSFIGRICYQAHLHETWDTSKRKSYEAFKKQFQVKFV